MSYFATPMPPLDIVGIKEIAERTGKPESLIRTWVSRGKLPPRDFTIGGRPAWRWFELKRKCADIRDLLPD